MTNIATGTYLKYHDGVEQPADDEAETIAGLIDALRSIGNKTFEDSGLALRTVHAKSHALLRGELVVPEGLPGPLQQGVFAKPGRYQVAVRISSSPGDILPDTISTPRGLAMKIIGVEGDRLPGSEGATTQDFVMVDGPAFTAPTPKKFLGNLKMLAGTTDKSPGLKQFASSVFQVTEKIIEAVGGESGTLTSLGGHPETHPLGETYYTQVPIRWGDHIAKVSLAPVSPELKALTDAPVDLTDKPNGLRETIVDFFSQHGGQWDLRAQLCTDIDKMPIEDASVVWPEDLSPFLTVAHLTVSPQPSYDDAKVDEINQGMAFSPWHGLQAHRPLGGVMRARKATYEMSSKLRAEHGGCPIHEPRNTGTTRP